MILQVIINSFITGGLYALIALGFSLLYNTFKFIPFFYGAFAIFAGYFLYLFNSINLPFSLGIILSFLVLIILGLLIDFFLLRKFRERKAGSVIMLILGLALGIFLENLLLAIFGPNIKSISLPFENITFNFFNSSLTLIQLIVIFISLSFLVITFFSIYKSRYGLVIRSLISNPLMAEILGVNKEDIFRKILIFTSLIAAIGGILYGIEYNLEPTAGTNLTIKAFTSAIIGGLEFLPGSIFGGFLLGFIENISVLFLPSAFKDGITFIILFLFLIFKPKGMFGKKTREEMSG
ncbi:MAG: branched-chain amino acid ABC transporter permease [Patescibacteria group bacterium]|nr:branched-chain amino acid ABC transporter permease [Patescibacteria group bacterium]